MKHARTRRRFTFSKNLIMMLVLLVVIIFSIWSWFTVQRTVTADGIVVKSGVPSEVSVAPVIYSNNGAQEGPGVFSDQIVFDNQDGLHELSKDCTGDGMNLIVPEFVSSNDKDAAKETGKIVKTTATPHNALSQLQAKAEKEAHPDQDMPEYQYIEHEFYVRSTDEKFYINGDSMLYSKTETPSSNASGTSLSTTPSAEKKSAYGNFNVDGLVGAMRVAFIGQPATSVSQTWYQDGDEYKLNDTTSPPIASLGVQERQLLWVPRPDVYLDVYRSNWDNWHLFTGVRSDDIEQDSSGKRISALTYCHKYYAVDGNAIELKTDEDAVCSSGGANANYGGAVSLGERQDIATYHNNTLTSVPLRVDTSLQSRTINYYVYKIKMRIWIEGTDAEARRAMDGGEFNLTLGLSQ